ncbi:MAG: DUF2817 domain-containing protein [Spirochaetales bacterium]|nr:DUF2817 domain-containing protein [Spirochaetales bacterium]
MKKTILLLSLMIVVAPLWGQSDASYRVDGWKGSAAFKQQRNYQDFLKRVHSIKGSSISKEQIGSVTYDGVEYRVMALIHTPERTPEKYVLFISGAHGNETAGPEAIISFFGYIGTHPELFEDIAIYAIPMVNPWGWVHNIRQNANGYDINRDFVNFLTKEARIVSEFGARHEYELVIDHHEAHAGGAFIYAYGYEDSETSRELMRYLKEDGYAVAEQIRSGTRYIPGGVVSIPSGFTSMTPTRWRNRSTIARYFNMNGTAHSFTMETSLYKQFRHRIAVHVEVMKFFIDRYR